jgi:hypothetical protein
MRTLSYVIAAGMALAFLSIIAASLYANLGGVR